MHKRFTALLEHDNGQFNLSVNASSQEKAIRIIMLVENCPRNAILNIKENA